MAPPPFFNNCRSLKRLFVFSFLLATLITFYNCLPEPLFKAPVSSVLLSKQGKLLGAHISTDEQWRFPPLKQIPEKFKKSIIAFEDKRFYQHIGIDPLAIARALKLNIKAGRVVSGGSTLSMQVIRLASQNPERTLWQKTTEAFKALRLETRYSKDEILALYASYAPFGGNVVGLEAASWRYFGRAPDKLSWAESAMLAVLPNSPALIHPGRKRDQLKAKRDRLLKKLFEKKIIAQLDYQLAVAEELPIKPKLLPRLAPHLLDTLSSKKTTKKQQRFETTIDYVLQSRIKQLAKHHAESLALKDIHNLAILVVDNQTFEVKSYIGNAPPAKGGAKFGQAIDLIRRPRSTGSTLKPFLFARMIEQGEILPETLVADVPIRYTGYRPKNFDRKFRGAVRAKQALASSLNIPAVNMLSMHGVERFLTSLRNMGMTTLHRRSRDYGLPLILGGAEGTLWELTSMYANLSRRAQQDSDSQRNNYFQLTTLKQGKTATKNRSEISPASAWMTLQALLEVGRPGTEAYWKRFQSSHKIAWKTGTSFGHRDAWAIGTTPQYTVGVWVGNAAGEGRQGMTGVKVAAPILFGTFNRLPLKGDWFRKPIGQMKTVSICKNDGFLANDFCETKDYQIPQNSHFDRISTNNQIVHLDKNNLLRVHSSCESVNQMLHQNWFTLPPDQAYYFQQKHANYKALPKWRKDCQQSQITETKGKQNTTSPISLIYPQRNAQIYIPRELAGKQGKTIFKAIHGNAQAKLFWHLDNTFLGTTQTFHQQAIQVAEGKHKLTLVDEDGNRVEQAFMVLSR
ncbi:MAG: penicillin-binding protein 1C [Cocleimonas sp.]